MPCQQGEAALPQLRGSRGSKFSVAMSSTVDKALGLLVHFDESRAEIGLSDLARLSGLDKSAILRMANAMATHGLLEQRQDTKKYRLGSACIRLAQLREQATPTEQVLRPIVDQLANDSQETTHCSLLFGEKLVVSLVAESPQINRVHMDLGLVLPLAATASGLAVLAYSDPRMAAAETASVLPAFTDETLTDPDQIRREIEKATRRGYSISKGYFEAQVHSVAAPIFGRDGGVLGTLAIASPSHRMNQQKEASNGQLVRQAAAQATLAMGAVVPAKYRTIQDGGMFA